MEHLGICIVGSINFHTGIGKITYALCEMFSRFTRVSFIPVDGNPDKFIELPNGRQIEICKNKNKIGLTFYSAILWNGIHDQNIEKMPKGGLHYAVMAFDADRVPEKWVKIINERFDGLYCTNRHLEECAIKSGVKVPLGTLPLALDLKSLLAKNIRLPVAEHIVIGSVAAFHPRKNHDILIKAFISLQEEYENIKLKIHSNLNFDGYYEYCKSLILHSTKPENIDLTCGDLSSNELSGLINSIDIFANVSRGEGFSIGPREASALGKVLVLSSARPHLDFVGIPGCFIVKADLPVPCFYPEVESIVAGFQYDIDAFDLNEVLISAVEYVRSKNTLADALNRSLFASKWDFSRMGFPYLNTLSPRAAEFLFKGENYTDVSYVPAEIKKDLESKFGENSEGIGLNKRLIVQMHDGGFFSIFNIFVAQLVHNVGYNKYFEVFPDWDVSRFVTRNAEGDTNIVSFCYGKPDDGNIFNKLFIPLDKDMNLSHFKCEILNSKINAEAYFCMKDEPLLTYKNADLLYQSQDFTNFRLRYNETLNKYIKLSSHLKNKLDAFCKQFEGKFVIAAHVRHPSHVIEQLDNSMPTPGDYIEKIKAIIQERKIEEWCIFLATDQERTIKIFLNEFGNKVLFYKQVRRLTDSEDIDFDVLPENEKAIEGFQLQHKVAKYMENWSISMAEDVILDAWTMAKANILLHVVSNVSTAVSYIGPNVEFISMRGKNKCYL